MNNLYDVFMMNGRLFHRVLAAFPKHLLPYVTPCIFGPVIRASDSDLRDLVCKYVGAVPFSNLKAYTRIWYFHLYITGSQCREFKACVIRCRFRVISQAAEFCTLCRHAIRVPGMPYRRALP